MTKFFLSFFLFLSFLGYSQENLPLIPIPKQIEFKNEYFELDKNTVIFSSDINSFEALFLKENIKLKTGLDLQITSSYSKGKSIQMSIQIPDSTDFDKEKYELKISKNVVQLSSFSNQGLFYGIQTFLQSIPFQQSDNVKIACVTIVDEPKYKWRGMHLDVCRHFFSIDFIKKYIDYISMYKMNTFHWHLTDDQGWRIEIKKYPKLTEVGAWRDGSMVGHYNEQRFDTLRYGGFYTQEEIKEVVKYAQQRHVTIVPEIEMPGHALAALASYPEFSCTGGPFEVAKVWGVLDDVFCPKDETFTFLENILSEVIDLFPSKYIHIGGDESPKVRWKSCPHCQSLIKKEGLKDEHELQSYFIQRIEKFVNSKGRKIIGWDEILEGGLAPNAAVMSWRGTEGGIAAAKQKHFVVMTPGSHCYFDHYQGDPKNEPIAFGGYTPVEKVYSFNPTPNELSKEEATYILGAQANVWTEYIETPEHVEYMIMPRMAALSEVLWGTANVSNYKDFENRLITHFDFYEKSGINYSKAIYEVTTEVSSGKNGVEFNLKAVNPKGIRFTIDGSEPTKKSMIYTNPISVTNSCTIKAAYFENEKQKSNTIEQTFNINKSSGKKISLEHQPHENYGIGGSFTLVDGMKGNPSKFGRDWLGFSGKDVVATIDLDRIETISKIKLNVLKSTGSWIYFPKEIEFLSSEDGKKFISMKKFSSTEIENLNGNIEGIFKNTKAKYFKVIAKNLGIIPDGNPGSGSNAWLFIDEISVE
ncbi:MAG TPA: family 20 glycosylhydrolase [Flavobacterium sp.]|uniref:beta-N-acetylhexosaminidase n=2 Tax=Flavobacterium TaxID=237 RepID=UPI0025C2F3E2|nr:MULTISPECIES: family 20 glycosylhydrolase [unclassified Flavobacterium]HRE77428.1 family 20 glycosylhydrolase [Flavobacterium sp.]